MMEIKELNCWKPRELNRNVKRENGERKRENSLRQKHWAIWTNKSTRKENLPRDWNNSVKKARLNLFIQFSIGKLFIWYGTLMISKINFAVWLFNSRRKDCINFHPNVYSRQHFYLIQTSSWFRNTDRYVDVMYIPC